MMIQYFLSIMIISLGGAFSLIMARQFNLMKKGGTFALCAGCLIGLVDAGAKLMHPGSYTASFKYMGKLTLAFQIDPLSAFFLFAIFLISLLSAVYSFHYLNHSEKTVKYAVNYFFFSLLIASMALVVTAANIITFMLSWEVMSLSSYFLVIYDYQSEQNRKAGYLYFVFSHVGAMFIFAAFGLIYGYTGSFGFGGTEGIPENIKILIFVLSFIGFGSKAGVFPFHIWLPHAHPAAPSHISAVMSGVMIKTGIYGIVKMYSLLNLHTPVFGNIVICAGAISGILGVVYALGQHDIKRLLAYHSVENIGIILIGIGIGMLGVSSGNPVMAILGFSGGLLHVLNHSIFKSLLFMGAGIVAQKTRTRSIDALGGLLKRMKITGTTFIIGSLAISGLPPFNGFVSEFLIYISGFKGVTMQSSALAMSIISTTSLAVIGGLALACFTKVVGVIFQGEPRTACAEKTDEKGPAMLIPMMVLAAGCLMIGVFPHLFIQMAAQAVSSMGLKYAGAAVIPFRELAENITIAALIFFIVILVTLAVRHILYKGKPVTTSGTWGCGFTQPTVKMQYTGSSYAASIVDFFRPAAPVVEHHQEIKGRFPEKTSYESHVKDIAEDNLERIVVKPVLFLFDKLRWIQHGDIHLYIGYIFLAIVLLLFFI